ncbi:hypothetical protein BV898_15918 [Hypsibius exemplaris]|uniref:Uncharacterized protein n=1 Tax=Hypsibius exemplaris TaxID=2072580 RepID=A0A9X6NC72_HYPEX|nr:hypothetical protein BV898_15918 [Hypsibius exemplaris]
MVENKDRYVHWTLGPGLLTHAVSTRKRPIEVVGCVIKKSAHPLLHIFTQLIVFEVPQIAMTVAFTLIYLSKVLWRKLRSIGS